MIPIIIIIIITPNIQNNYNLILYLVLIMNTKISHD